MIKLEEKKINAILDIQNNNEKKTEEGYDYFFLISLLPFRKPLDPLQKLELRSKLQAAVMESYKAYQRHQTGLSLVPLDVCPASTLSSYGTHKGDSSCVASQPT